MKQLPPTNITNSSMNGGTLDGAHEGFFPNTIELIDSMFWMRNTLTPGKEHNINNCTELSEDFQSHIKECSSEMITSCHHSIDECHTTTQGIVAEGVGSVCVELSRVDCSWTTWEAPISLAVVLFTMLAILLAEVKRRK